MYIEGDFVPDDKETQTFSRTTIYSKNYDVKTNLDSLNEK